jgi:hypothetical protein
LAQRQVGQLADDKPDYIKAKALGTLNAIRERQDKAAAAAARRADGTA